MDSQRKWVVEGINSVAVGNLSARQEKDLVQHYINKMPCYFPPAIAVALQESHPIQPGDHEFADFLPLTEYTQPPSHLKFSDKTFTLYPSHWKHTGKDKTKKKEDLYSYISNYGDTQIPKAGKAYYAAVTSHIL